MALRYSRVLPNLKVAVLCECLINKDHNSIKSISHNLQQYSQKRWVHNTNKTDHTTLLLNNNNAAVTSSHLKKYQSMSLKILKSECKTQGLKISGNKKELISRLCTVSSSAQSNANRDSKTVKLANTSNTTSKNPQKNKKKTKKQTIYEIIKEQSFPDNSGKPTTQVSSNHHSSDPITGVSNVSFPAMNKETISTKKVYMPYQLSLEPPLVLTHANADTIQVDHSTGIEVPEPSVLETPPRVVEIPELELKQTTESEPQEEETRKRFTPSVEPLTRRDKYFFSMFIAFVLFWWNIASILGNLTFTKNSQHKHKTHV